MNQVSDDGEVVDVKLAIGLERLRGALEVVGAMKT